MTDTTPTPQGERPDLTRDQFTSDYTYWGATGRWASDEQPHDTPPLDLDALRYSAEENVSHGYGGLPLASSDTTLALLAEADALRITRDRLAAAMGCAPHAFSCQGWRPGRILWDGPCTCWKSTAADVLAEVKRDAAASALNGEGRTRLADALAVTGIVVNDAALDRIVSAWVESMGKSRP